MPCGWVVNYSNILCTIAYREVMLITAIIHYTLYYNLQIERKLGNMFVLTE